MLAQNCMAAVQASITTPVRTNDDRQGPFFAATEENDLFGTPFGSNTDRHYTQGLKFTWLGRDDDLPRWARQVSDDLPQLGLHAAAQNLGYVFGQNMYTPQNLHTNALITDDRPYAGWLYGGVYLQRRGNVDDSRVPTEENFEVDFGTTGPASLAGTIQTWSHREYVPGDVPHGWHNQLAGEPGLLLKYERFWRLSVNDQTARYVDFIPHVGADLGNIMIFQNLGGHCESAKTCPTISVHKPSIRQHRWAVAPHRSLRHSHSTSSVRWTDVRSSTTSFSMATRSAGARAWNESPGWLT
jgi:hypothetical protein